jgi:hypothetical protein
MAGSEVFVRLSNPTKPSLPVKVDSASPPDGDSLESENIDVVGKMTRVKKKTMYRFQFLGFEVYKGGMRLPLCPVVNRNLSCYRVNQSMAIQCVYRFGHPFL